VKLHRNARTAPKTRELLVRRVLEEGWDVGSAAKAVGLSRRTGAKWLARYRREGLAGLQDRSSRPRRLARCTSRAVVDRVLALRHRRLVAAAIAERVQLPRSTVGAILRRHGLGRLKALQPPVPVVRYERSSPGELLHVDTKKLGRIGCVGHRIHGDRRRAVRGIGWEYAHVAVDDHSRLAYLEVLPDEGAESCTAFLERALRFYERHGIEVQRVLSDNGPGYRSHVFNAVCGGESIRHLFTKPYTPRTNGKAERLVQTLLREWAYARPYRSSRQRTAALRPWLKHYNHRRPHGGIGLRPPISRVPRP
jgi:transposase InsO family protein